MDVTLLERRTLGYGASGRNPGWIYIHGRTPGFALDIARAGRAMFPELLRDLPGGFEFRASGGLIYFLTPEQGAVFEEFVAARRADGLDMTLIDGAEVRRLVPPIRDDVLGASYCTEDAQMVTSTFVDALARGARAAGATIREGVTVERLIVDGDRVVGVATDDGRIDADATVIAMGAWSTALLADHGVDVPIGGERLQVMATTPQPFWVEPLRGRIHDAAPEFEPRPRHARLDDDPPGAAGRPDGGSDLVHRAPSDGGRPCPTDATVPDAGRSS